MDQNVKIVLRKKVDRVIKSLNSNNISGYFAENRTEAIGIVERIVAEGSTVASGGSVTLDEIGIIDHLRSGRYVFLDRYADGLTEAEVKSIYRGAFSADAYLTGLNAITESGEIYNVDGNGNRVAAIIYGPDKVIFVAGVNKIVKDLDEAIERNKRTAAPPNTIRLNKKTPCVKLGYCVDCRSEDRICNKYSLIKREREQGRMHVILIDEQLGY